MNLVKEIEAAQERINPFCIKTPCLHSEILSELNQGDVYLKLESRQHTGSFKMRGAMNKILTLSSEEKARGITTASTGNHAQGVARACQLSNCIGDIFLPETAAKSKIEALEKYPINIQYYGTDSLGTEIYAKRYAERSNKVWISPYNDHKILAGQGTIAIELLEALQHIDTIFVTVGGGGLVSGIASYLHHKSPHTRIVGCHPKNSPEMYLSVQAGKIVELKESLDTLSDGSAGGIEKDSITFPICQKLVDEFVLVDEFEIEEAIRMIYKEHNEIIEGAAAVAVAAFIKSIESNKAKTVVIVICGGNIDSKKFEKIIH